MLTFIVSMILLDLRFTIDIQDLEGFKPTIRTTFQVSLFHTNRLTKRH